MIRLFWMNVAADLESVVRFIYNRGVLTVVSHDKDVPSNPIYRAASHWDYL